MKFRIFALSILSGFWFSVASGQAASLKQDLSDLSLTRRIFGPELTVLNIKLAWKSVKLSEKNGFETAAMKDVTFSLGDPAAAGLVVTIPNLTVTKKIKLPQYRFDFGKVIAVTVKTMDRIDPTKFNTMKVNIDLKNMIYLSEDPADAESWSSFSADSITVTTQDNFALVLKQLLLTGTGYRSVDSDLAALKGEILMNLGPISLTTGGDQYELIPAGGALKFRLLSFGDLNKYIKGRFPIDASKDQNWVFKSLIEWSKVGGKFEFPSFDLTGFGSPLHADLKVSNFENLEIANGFPNINFNLVIDNFQQFLSVVQNMKSKNGKVYLEPQLAALLEVYMKKYADFDGDRVTLKITNDGRNFYTPKGKIE